MPPNDLRTYMRFLTETYGPPQFRPSVYYNQTGDHLEVYWADDHCCAEQVNVDGVAEFSLLRSMETGEVVGVTIHSVKHRLEQENMLAKDPERDQRARDYAAWAARQG